MTEIPTMAETRERIVRALEQDAQRQRESILALLSEADFTVEEIAQKLQLHQGLVRTRLAELREAGEVAGVREGEMTSRYRLV